MSCKEYQHPITLLLYEELPEAARTELETHIHECAHCNDAYESEKSMHSVLVDDAARWEIPPDLLVESRKALADELDRIEKKRSRWRIPAFSVLFTPMRLLESAPRETSSYSRGSLSSREDLYFRKMFRQTKSLIRKKSSKSVA